jgi:glycosyltransferase involved in cell wall biosynthesis
VDDVRISVVTPSYNQGRFLEETIRSVLEQRYPNVEYSVLDGGSTDRTIEILQRYDAQLSFWRSEKDGGQAASINEGFQRATGDPLLAEQ